MKPKQDKNKKILICTKCNYKNKLEEQPTIKEKVNQEKELEVIDKEVETLPMTEAECPKCHHKNAYYWTVQTRASDEPETKFFKCEKCKNIWRDFS